jgi:hypothetical protein
MMTAPVERVFWTTKTEWSGDNTPYTREVFKGIKREKTKSFRKKRDMFPIKVVHPSQIYDIFDFFLQPTVSCKNIYSKT